MIIEYKGSCQAIQVHNYDSHQQYQLIPPHPPPIQGYQQQHQQDQCSIISEVTANCKKLDVGGSIIGGRNKQASLFSQDINQQGGGGSNISVMRTVRNIKGRYSNFLEEPRPNTHANN